MEQVRNIDWYEPSQVQEPEPRHHYVEEEEKDDDLDNSEEASNADDDEQPQLLDHYHGGPYDVYVLT